MKNTQLSLDLTDLNILRDVVSQCAARGAFKPEEFSAIGRVYERLVAFLEASGAMTDTHSQSADSDTSAIENVPVLTDQEQGI